MKSKNSSITNTGAITPDMVVANSDPCYDFNYGASKGAAKTDYAEVWIRHDGVKRLEANIENETDECITACVHFLAGTDVLHDICLQVHDMKIGEDYPITADILTDKERKIIADCAMKHINTNRE